METIKFNESIKVLDQYASEQEHRQLRLTETTVHIVVSVSREDFPSKTAAIPIAYFPTASQAAWQVFLSDVRKKLEVEFVDRIIDRSNYATVHRTLSLRNGGQYFVRQREESSVLEVLNTSVTPVQIVWPITKVMMSAKESLSDLVSMQEPIETRVDTLIRRPQGRAQQTAAAKAILEAPDAGSMIKTLNDITIPKPFVRISGLKEGDSLLAKFTATVEAASNKNLGSRRPLDSEVDHVALYRLAIEGMNRMSITNTAKTTVCTDEVLDFICESIEDFRDEVDVVVPALQLLT